MKRKAKRFLAGLCVAFMLTQSIGETTLTALAAEDIAYTATEESTETENTVSGGNPETAVSGGNEETTVSDGNEEETVSGGDTGETLPVEEVIPVTADDGTPQVDEEGNVTVNGEFWGTIDENGMFTVSSDMGVVTSYCFKGWDAVTGIRFEEGAYIKSIGSNGFQNCVNLRTVDLSNCTSLTQIGDYAFSGCTGLEKVTFNDNLQYINKNAFEKCTALQDITLVKGLISIRENAFNGCKSLSHVRLETMNVVCKTTTGAAATGIFTNCNLESVDFAYKDENVEGEKKNVIIPANLFNKATFAENVNFVIPYKIQEIGEGAFQGSNLMQVTFENGVQTPSALSTIGKNAFNGCASLENVTFPGTLQTIGEGAFTKCTAFTEIIIPNSVNDLGKNSFMGCKSVTNLQLPNATTVIGDYAFRECTSLEKVVIPQGTTFTGKGEFFGCSKLTDVTIADTIETIGDETFKGCVAIQTIKLPDSVTIIGKGAFESCVALRTVEYSVNLLEIRDTAFKGCTVFRSNVFPLTLEKIGASAFEECQSFRSTIIPFNVTSIGNKAFFRCYGIETLTIDSLQLTNCGTAIFDECLIREVVFPEGIEVIPANLFSQAGFTTDCVITIPNTVTEIGNNAFGGTNSAEDNITSVVFEEGTKLTRIGNSAFKYCTAMTQFTIPDTVVEIGANAFEGCNKITSIVIPESVTKIGAGAFSGCSVLTDITYNAINVTTSNQNIFAKCNIKRILIGNKVSSFPAYLFKGAQFSTNTETGEIEMITLIVPASVEKIGQYALPNIANLQGIKFEEGSNLQTIEQYAFYQCINLTDINLPDTVITIGNYAFSGCTKLGTKEEAGFDIPTSVVTLGSGAFSNCPGLTSITIPAGVSKILDKTFQNDTGLTSVTWDVSLLTEIGASAFEGCSGLTEMNIPSGTIKIGAAAFKNCTGLTKIVIPASVTSIAGTAFDGCDNALYFVVPGSYAEKWLKDKGIITRNLLAITYELNGGTNNASNPAGYEAGDTFTFAPATRNGYIFKGWFLDEEFNIPITGVEGYSEDLTVYAKWEIEIYTINYELNGGTNHKDNPATYTFLDKVTFKNPEKEGYTFEGWYSDPEFKKTFNNIPVKSYGNKTVYAKWSGGVTLAPTASVESGSSVKTGTKVFLTSPTPGASIYYTMDGSEPTVTSKQYVEGIAIDKAVTIKAFAVKKGCDASEVVTFTYELVNEAEDWGDILVEDRQQFENGDEVPKGIWVAGVEDSEYTGKKITFALRVYDGKTLLKEKTDYTVAYANNKDAADKNAEKKAPTVTINAKGNYKGKVVIKFTISPKNIASGDITAEDIITNVTGKLQKPVPVVTYGKTKLRNKTDFTYEYLGTTLGGYQSKGEYQIKITGCKNFTGERIVTYTLVEGTSITKAKITAPKKCSFTGELLTPDIDVKMGKEALIKGVDYEVTYSNNRDAGTATAIITGKGNYYGAKKVTFKILPIATLNKAKFAFDKTSVTYTGNAYEIGKGIHAAVTLNGTTLVEGKDYTCSYLKNTDAGTATIVFTGKGGYTGTVRKSFKIVTAEMTGMQLQFLDAEGNVKKDAVYAYEKGGVKPNVLLTYNGMTLTAGKDYTVSYKKNTALGRAEIVVRGKKNFKGTLNGTFTIAQQDVSELRLTAQDVMFKNAAGAVSGAKPVVMDVNGKKLAEGTDYKVTYVYTNNTRMVNNGTMKRAGSTVNVKGDIIPVESLITVKITGNGNYRGTLETTIRVFKNNISTAKITVKPQAYTGREVQPGIDQMTVMIGKKELNVGDYEIVSYKNNIKKGNAEVTIRGIGNYGGTKTVKFKIAEKTFSLFDWIR